MHDVMRLLQGRKVKSGQDGNAESHARQQLQNEAQRHRGEASRNRQKGDSQLVAGFRAAKRRASCGFQELRSCRRRCGAARGW